MPDTRIIEEILVEDIVRDFLPMYPTEGGSWQETVEYLYEHEADRMESLYESVKLNGVRKPIVLTDEDNEKRVSDGTHRVALALYHGFITLPTATEYEQLDENALYYRMRVQTAEAMSREETELITELFSSWRLSDQVWVNSDISSGSATCREIYLNLSDPKLSRAIKSRARKLLSDAAPGLRFTISLKLIKDGDSFE